MKKFLTSPFLIIIFIWFLFSSPFFLQGKVPFPSSYQVNFFSPWNAYPEFASPYKNGATPDVIGQIYPWRYFTIETWKSGEVPLWNPYSFSGTPHLANYQSAVFSPLNIGFFVFQFIDWWSMLILLQPLLAGVFTILFIRSLGLSKLSQIIGAVPFMFCGFLVTWMMYGTLGYAILFLPLALFAIEKFLTSQNKLFLLLLGICIPFSFFSGHFQISIYLLLFIIYYLTFKLLTSKQKKVFIPLFLSVVGGLFISALQILPSIEAYTLSIRSSIFQKTEAIPWEYLPTFFAPDFFGNPVTRNDWFGHYAEWNAYIGLIPLFFEAYSLMQIRKKHILIFFFPLIGSLLLAFQTPLLDLLVYLKVPVLSTSAASRIIVIFSFSACILAACGFSKYVVDIKEKRYRGILILSGIFLGIFALLWSLVFFKLFMPLDKIQIAYSNLRLPTIFLILLCFFVLIPVLLKKRKVIVFSIIALLTFSAIDSMRFAIKWQPFDPKELVFASTPVSAFFPTISGTDRVFASFGAEGAVYYKLSVVEGYDAVYIGRYGEFISSLETGIQKPGFRSVVAFPKTSLLATPSANLLGIKYVIHKVSDGQNVWEFPFWRYDPESLNLIYADNGFQILENENAFPRAFLVDSILVENNPQNILNSMFSKDTNLLRTAVIEEELQDMQPLATGSADIISATSNTISIETKSPGPSFLVLTDAYHPGWNAYIDEKETKIYRTDYAFRGVFIPEGEHIVEFRFEPESFRLGIIIAIIGVITLGGLVVFYRKK